MRASLTIMLVLIARVAAAQSVLDAKVDGQPVGLTADEAACTNERCVFKGGVLLTSGTTVLSAEMLTIDFEESEDKKRKIKGAVAEGDVLLIDGNAMTTCQRVELNGDLITGTLSLAEIRVKRPGSVDPKLKGFDAFGAGVDQFYMSGVITRTGPKSFLVKNAYFTPCDCGKDKRPIFSMRAEEATIELNSHAVFKKPVVQPGDVPLPFPFALPALYVPISKRKTGLLPPAFRVLQDDGFYAEDSFFITMGPSVDATIGVGLNEARGPREMLELRYAPDPTTYGQLNAIHMFDSKYWLDMLAAEYRRDGMTPADALAKAKEDVPRGVNRNLANRVTAAFTHRSGTFERFGVKIDGAFFSDAGLPAVQAYTVAAAAQQYAASRLALDYRGDLWRAAVGAAVYQDFFGNDRGVPTLWGPQAGRIVQRMPDVGFFLAPVALPLGFRVSAEGRFNAGFAFGRNQTVAYEDEDPNFKVRRFETRPADAPAIVQQVIDAGLRPPGAYADCATLPSRLLVDDNGSPLLNLDGAPIVDAYGQPLGMAGQCARPLRFGRFDATAAVARPFQLGFLSVRPEIFGLVAIGADSIANNPSARGFAAMRVELATHFGRVFQASPDLAIRHRVRPTLEYLLIPAVFGAMPAYIFDERDQFRAAHQLVIGVETDLFRKVKSGVAARAFTLSLRQQVNLGFDGVRVRDLRSADLTPAEQRTLPVGPGFGSLIARANFDWLPLRLGVRSIYDTQKRELTEIGGRAEVFDGKGTRVVAEYARYTSGGTAPMNTGLFELAPGGAVVANLRSGALHIAMFGVSLQPLPWLQLSYGFGAAFGDGITTPRFAPQYQTINARIVGACGCFGVDLGVRLNPEHFTTVPRAPYIDFALTIGDYTFRPQ